MAAQRSPKRIYLNFSGFNSNPVGGSEIAAEKAIQLNFPLLNQINPGEYDVTVARFSIPTTAIHGAASALGIVVETHTLPIVGEWDTDSQLPFLVDVLTDQLNDPSGTLIYEPTFYRKSSFVGQGNLTQFDCKFSIRYQDGTLVPLMIGPQRGWTLKIALIRSDILY